MVGLTWPTTTNPPVSPAVGTNSNRSEKDKSERMAHDPTSRCRCSTTGPGTTARSRRSSARVANGYLLRVPDDPGRAVPGPDVTTDLQHARQVVNVFVEFRDADDYARGAGQFRPLTGFPLGHHAHINKVGANFPEHVFHQARVDTLQWPRGERTGEGSGPRGKLGRALARTDIHQVGRQDPVEHQSPEMEPLYWQQVHEGLRLAHRHGLQRANHYEGCAPVGQKPLYFLRSLDKTVGKGLEQV